MCDTSLIESICYSVLSQCGIECHHCKNEKNKWLLTSYLSTLDILKCTYVENYAWSRPEQWSSTLLWFHKRSQYWFWVAAPVLPIHFQNDWHSCPAPCRRAIYTRRGSARRRKSWFMYITFSSSFQKKLCNISYLFKYFTSGLNFILFTDYFSSAQTRVWSKTLHRVIEQFIQGVLAWKVLLGQRIKMVHGTVWSLWVAWCGACF